MQPTDDALLAALHGGDDQAVAKLLERYAPTVYRFGVKMCRDPEDAKDVMQDTLLAAARGLREFRGGATLSTWLFTIARSFCIKKRRQRVGTPGETEPLESGGSHKIPATDRTPDQVAEDREIGAVLDAAIHDLEPMYREVLVLRDVEGLSAPEVATVLGIGVDAVKSRLHRARLSVRDRIAPLVAAPAEPSATSACPDVVPILSRYLEGEIGPDQCAEMDRHVSQCARCRARCDSLRSTLALCRRSGRTGTVPPNVQEAVRTALREIA
ncbi:MAG: sigma-70 family RNA polymerase sigma factor [Polyangiaceae bacterium]|jgi:RNA polymerase sigma-70 factor (ECF subfamily)